MQTGSMYRVGWAGGFAHRFNRQGLAKKAFAMALSRQSIGHKKTAQFG
ncbi:MAG: hypothetical protein Q7U57_09235 [Methylovulum sp.]|nr:hypothetical protein [Methylovulum sp.]